jgi:SAM-dependent methyltransferase
MTERDREFFLRCFQAGVVRSPFLDVGSMSVNEDMGLTNLREAAKKLGIEESLGVDFAAGPGVDIIADFSKPPAKFKEDWPAGSFGSVAIFNVLEHTFDPATILENALSLVRPGGTLLAVTPSVWPIHNYPIDCLRLNPDWFRYFADRHGLEIEQDSFMWLSEDFGLVPVESLRKNGLDQIPTFFQLGKQKSPWRYRLTTTVNRLFPTYFRSNWHPAMVALGVVFKRGN